MLPISIYPSSKCQTVFWLNTCFKLTSSCFILSGNWGAQGDKADGIDTILEVNEAAQMAGDISDHGSDQSDGGNGNDEGGVSVENG